MSAHLQMFAQNYSCPSGGQEPRRAGAGTDLWYKTSPDICTSLQKEGSHLYRQLFKGLQMGTC